MRASLLPPRDNYTGNLVWNREQFIGSGKEITKSLNDFRGMGYWASPYPEGDGITFNLNEGISKTPEEMLSDFRRCFEWMEIELAESGDSNEELAKLESDRVLECMVIVPLDKVFIEETFTSGPFTFACRAQFDDDPFERLDGFSTESVQFKAKLQYKDLLKLNKTIDHNNYVINRCLALAEHALDLVRYQYSSFIKREFTPDPAGQQNDGFYSVNIIPMEKTHLKPLELSGISRPLSVSNNWLGPKVDGLFGETIEYLSSVHNGDIDNPISAAVVVALRSCRQSFYSIGSESQFLNLVFTLDGLTEPEGSGWKHRTYIAALLSFGDYNRFEGILKRYDELYVEVRNKLVHNGMDFYQLPVNPDEVCEEIYMFIKDIIRLIAQQGFETIDDMRAYALQLLRSSDYREKYTSVINTVSSERGTTPRVPSW